LFTGLAAAAAKVERTAEAVFAVAQNVHDGDVQRGCARA
jgi:hypothetical protein